MTGPDGQEHWQYPGQPGMSLRDWFAGQVISPQLVQAYGKTPEILAQKAYAIADAMLAARAATESEEVRRG